MDRLILPLLGVLVLIAMGAGAVWWWDRHPPIAWRGPIPIIGPTIRLPDSLQHERDQAIERLAELKRKSQACEDRVGELGATMKSQNDGVLAERVESERILALAEEGRREGERRAENYKRVADLLAAYEPPEDELCQRMKDADAAIVRSFQ